MSIGKRIKERRKALGYSAEDLAKQLGKSPATIYRYESGDIEKLPGDLLAPLADLLNTSTSYLLGLDNTVPPAVPRQITDQELKFALFILGHLQDGIDGFLLGRVDEPAGVHDQHLRLAGVGGESVAEPP